MGLVHSKGLFVTFEGGEGAGKSTQIRRLAEALRRAGREVLTTREPGGSPGAEALRHVLLSGAAEPYGIDMEAILFSAARNDHVETVIRPALAKGFVVLCDRFTDSSRVYQGVSGGLEPSLIDGLERLAVNGVRPDVTLILDLPASIGLQRARARAEQQQVGAPVPDRFEKEEVETHEARRRAFLEIAAGDPERCVVVDALQPLDTVAEEVLSAVEARLGALEREVVASS